MVSKYLYVYSITVFLLYGANIKIHSFELSRSRTFKSSWIMNAQKIDKNEKPQPHPHNHTPTLWKDVPQLAKIRSFVTFDKESNRKLRRTIFSKQDWRNHRSSNRYFKDFLSMPFSLVLRGLTIQALVVMIWAFFLVAFNLFAIKFTSKWKFPLPLLSLPNLPVSLTSPSLGLLLVFRTNTAYARWEKASVTWASIASKSYDLMRQGALWIQDPLTKVTLFRYITAFAKTLKWNLGHEDKDRRLSDDLYGILSTTEITTLMKSKNRVQHIILKIAETVCKAGLTPNAQSHMDKSICDLTDSAFTCERIYTTPIPLVYTKHTARFLLLWLLTVPLTLFHEFRASKIPYALLYVPLISFFHSIFLFGIEELGVQIEEPFSILPLATICTDIQQMGIELLESCEGNLSLTPPLDEPAAVTVAATTTVPVSSAVEIESITVSAISSPSSSISTAVEPATAAAVVPVVTLLDLVEFNKQNNNANNITAVIPANITSSSYANDNNSTIANRAGKFDDIFDDNEIFSGSLVESSTDDNELIFQPTSSTTINTTTASTLLSSSSPAISNAQLLKPKIPTTNSSRINNFGNSTDITFINDSLFVEKGESEKNDKNSKTDVIGSSNIIYNIYANKFDGFNNSTEAIAINATVDNRTCNNSSIPFIPMLSQEVIESTINSLTASVTAAAASSSSLLSSSSSSSTSIGVNLPIKLSLSSPSSPSAAIETLSALNSNNSNGNGNSNDNIDGGNEVMTSIVTLKIPVSAVFNSKNVDDNNNISKNYDQNNILNKNDADGDFDNDNNNRLQ